MKSEKTLREYHSRKNRFLVFSIILDLLGMASYLFPLLAEFSDMIFAPIYGLAIYIMYRKKTIAALIGGLGGAIEEFLPATDVIPSATIMWVYTFLIKKNSTLEAFVKERSKELETVEKFLD